MLPPDMGWALLIVSVVVNVFLFGFLRARGREATQAWANRDYWRTRAEEKAQEAACHYKKTARMAELAAEFSDMITKLRHSDG